jgi:hypothetical protein
MGTRERDSAGSNKARLDDRAKDAAPASDHGVRPPAKEIADQDDRLGGLAKISEGARTGDASPQANEQSLIKDALDNVVQSYHWLDQAAQQQIETLRTDLKKEDEPPWHARLGEAVLNVALAAGAAGGAEFIAAKLVRAVFAGGKEFVKVMFEEGIGKGVEAGRGELAGHDSEAIDPFIDSQKQGVRGMHHENQTHFIDVGRHQVTTLEQATALKAACSRANIEQAAREQEDATRNAWISYLAQTTYGSVGRRSATGDLVGPSTTNMATQDQRDRTNRAAPGYWPERAPDLADAVHGDAPGVLTVVARLPAISNHRMHGTPKVEMAFLNGVNETTRKHYAGPLADSAIPRLIVAKVEGDQPNFTVNVDEKGDMTPWLDRSHSTWLRARATVGHPERVDDFTKLREGLALLLRELVPGTVDKKIL